MAGDVQNYKDLIVWQRSRALVKDIYGLSANFPADERFGLVSQIRRAAVSIPSNIAEGRCRSTGRDFANFLSHAIGSLAEVETQLLLAADLGFVSEQDVEPLLSNIEELQRMLFTLRKKVN